ncbi:(5-formylfuran-3-yl)methyl phosphate synthase [Caldimonas tepidiphila]|uniref:(5-formylfuran-3-yl)methyl phosphate synthase n=1 Tax=Caldimonas tepidiphila TaxID=2315841 RepID=UPI000E5C2E10|nr:(5-formylfuran-3-yl)methyl phosphate synthase [Caldimonas tepidiphila]
MTRLLVSVRSVEEALLADEAGADLIDLKEPQAGALGGLPHARVREIVSALRARGSRREISATIGDWPMGELPAILAQVDAVADCGVDYVKVGIDKEAGAAAVLSALAACGRRVVPVFIADRGLDAARIEQACAGPFPALMLDTADKLAGSLFDCLEREALHGFVERCRRSGRLAGLAGALRMGHLPLLRELAPDFAGFRSAVCDGARTGALDAQRLQALHAQLCGAPAG